MNNENFMIDFAKLIEIDFKDLKADLKLEAIEGWDSLAVVSTIALVDQYFGLSISGEDIFQCRTFSDVLDLINNEKNSVTVNI